MFIMEPNKGSSEFYFLEAELFEDCTNIIVKKECLSSFE